MAYQRDPLTVPDDSSMASTVRQGVADQNNKAIDDVYIALNTHANNENGRSHPVIDKTFDDHQLEIEELQKTALSASVPVFPQDRDKILTNDGTKSYWGNFEVRKPTNTLADGITIGTPLELTGTPYRNVYGVARDYREARVATDPAMNNIVGTYQVDNDTVTASKDDLSPETEYYYDLRDVDTDGAESLRSIPTKFVTGEKLATPYLSMPATAIEGAEVNGAYTVADGTTPVFTTPPEITDFQDLGSGLFKFTAPLVGGATDFVITLKATHPEKWESDEASKTISVANVPIQDGPTVVFNDADGWDKTPVNGSIEAPATSVGVNNSNQIVSVKPEIVQTNGGLTVDSSTTSTSLVTPEEVTDGDKLLLVVNGELAEETAGTVTLAADGTDNTVNLDDMVNGKSGSTALIALNSEDQMPRGVYISGVQVWANSGYTNLKAVLARSADNSSFELVRVSTATNTVTADFDMVVFDPYFIPISDGYTYYAGVMLPSGYTSSNADYPIVLFELPTGAQGDTVSLSATVPSGYSPVAGYQYQYPLYNTDLTASGLSAAPTAATKLLSGDLKVGYGITDEYLGPEEALTLGTGSTTTSIVLESSESIKDNIFITGGFHNNLTVDSADVDVSAVSEVENGGVYTTTIIPTSELSQVPNTVAIPNRCTLSPASYAYVLDGDNLKITGAEIVLEDNSSLKRLAMKVEGADLKFNSGKIYIKERV